MMNTYSSDYPLFMEDAYNEAYQEMIDYFEEKSHRKLNFDYRQVKAAKDYPDRGIKTGDRLLCVYDLKNVQITYPGGAWGYDDTPMNKLEDEFGPEKGAELKANMIKDNKEVQKNIHKKGNTDHQSYGQRLLAVKHIDKNGNTINQWTYKKNPGMEFKVGGIVAGLSGRVFMIKLGEIETEENKTFKSTKIFSSIIDGGSIKNNIDKLGDYENYSKYFRGVEKDNNRKLKSGIIGDITIPDGTKKIATRAYSKCKQITSVTMPNSVMDIGADAFMGCISLNKVILSKNLKKIGDCSFASTNIESIEIPNSVIMIDQGAFSSCTSLKTIKLSNSIQIINEDTFSHCESLVYITIPISVKKINENAFDQCINLKDVKIIGTPEIDRFAFLHCPNLSEESKKRILELQPKAKFKSYFESYDKSTNEYLYEIKKLAEDDEETIESKSPVYKVNYYMRDNLQYKYVSPVLQKARNRNAIIDFTAKFMDDHHDELSTSGPVYSITFGKKETEFFYNLFGITKEKLLEIYNGMIDETYYGHISSVYTGIVTQAPHKLLIIAILIDAIQNGYSEIEDACEYITAWCDYPILLKKQWTIGVNKEVMDYTIEHLPGKFKIVTKKLNTLNAILKYDANCSVALYRNSMKTSGADNLYMDFIYRIRNQIKSTLKNIGKQYYDNVENNKTQHQSISEFDDGQKADQEGINTNIAQAVEKTVNKFSAGELNNSIIKIVAEHSQIDKSNLAGYISQIFAAKNNRLSKFIEDIITLYFNKDPSNTSLDDSGFLNFGLALYRSIGTSKDPIMSEIKEILNMWMNDVINIRSFYNRDATVTAYTRGIFNYFIMMIKYYN